MPGPANRGLILQAVHLAIPRANRAGFEHLFKRSHAAVQLAGRQSKVRRDEPRTHSHHCILPSKASMSDRVLSEVSRLVPEMVEFLQEMIRIPTANPPGECDADFAQAISKQ